MVTSFQSLLIGYGGISVVEVQAVEQSYPLPKDKLLLVWLSQKLQIEGAAIGQADFELVSGFIVDEDLDKLQRKKPEEVEGCSNPKKGKSMVSSFQKQSKMFALGLSCG